MDLIKQFICVCTISLCREFICSSSHGKIFLVLFQSSNCLYIYSYTFTIILVQELFPLKTQIARFLIGFRLQQFSGIHLNISSMFTLMSLSPFNGCTSNSLQRPQHIVKKEWINCIGNIRY